MATKVEAKRLSQVDFNALIGKLGVHLPPKLINPLLGHIEGIEKELEKEKAKRGQPALQLAPESVPAPAGKPPPPAVKKGYNL